MKNSLSITKRKHIVNIMIRLFKSYDSYNDVKDELRELHSCDLISDEQYNFALEHWNTILNLYIN